MDTRTTVPTPADWQHLHRLRDTWNAARLDAGRAPLPDDDQTRRLLVLLWRDRAVTGRTSRGKRRASRASAAARTF